jgi:hypothetical protein
VGGLRRRRQGTERGKEAHAGHTSGGVRAGFHGRWHHLRHKAIAVPAHSANKLIRRVAIAQRFADCHNVTIEAHIPDKLPRPQLLEQFLLAHDPRMLRQQIGQHLKHLGP